MSILYYQKRRSTGVILEYLLKLVFVWYGLKVELMFFRVCMKLMYHGCNELMNRWIHEPYWIDKYMIGSITTTAITTLTTTTTMTITITTPTCHNTLSIKPFYDKSIGVWQKCLSFTSCNVLLCYLEHLHEGTIFKQKRNILF